MVPYIRPCCNCRKLRSKDILDSECPGLRFELIIIIFILSRVHVPTFIDQTFQKDLAVIAEK